MKFNRWLTIVALFAAAAFAQASRDITGIIVAESGASVPGATVIIRDETGRAVASASSDATGSFTLSEVPSGRNQLYVEKSLFAAARADIGAGAATAPLRIVLKVATTRQTVQVVRDASEEIPYSVPEATSATKLETPLMETPFSIEVVPNHVILDQQAIRLQDVTGIVSGVRTNFGYDDLYQAFALRGFETNVTLRNGERVSGGVGRNSVDLANVEDVEVLKGRLR